MNKDDNNIKKRFSRRQFIKWIGALLFGSAIAGGVGINLLRDKVAALSEEDKDGNKIDRQWVMVFDLRLCDGCLRCSEACVKEHYLHKDQSWIKVFETIDHLGTKVQWPKPCMQCENAPCVRVCPVHATYKTDDGVTLINPDKCIGCRMCMAACPYNARTFNWDDPPPAPATFTKPSPEYPVPQIKGTVGKCEFCVHNIRFGKLPECVKACVMGVIFVGDRISDLATNGIKTVKLSDFIVDNDAFRLKEELNTEPRVYYIPGHGQDYTYDD